MFNSQKINNDPFPYVSSSGSRHANPGWMGSEYFSNRQERKEYDNNPNPLLIEFRVSVDLFSKQVNTAHRWNPLEVTKWWLDEFLHTVSVESNDTGDAEYWHARKVLERLVNVYGSH